jgi:lipase
MRYDVVTPEVERVLADRLGDQLTIERLDCGHLVYWERFDDTVAVVRNFLG